VRKLLLVLSFVLAPLALAADRVVPYEDMHAVFARVAEVAGGKYFRIATVMQSKDPAVATADIKLLIKSKGGDIPVPVTAEGATAFPVRDDLLKENPDVLTNVGEGQLEVRIVMSVETPPEQRFRYELMVAMQDEVKGILARQGFMTRMMAPDFEGLRISFPPGTAATATVEAAKPETFKADAEGTIRIPDRKAWRKENPFVQLSAMPQRIEMDTD
jgi:hypothetical protein